mmetsp:Transcript_3385/g.8051  ORF Transcript_3385/g.8051 Transcript_3385/m.8051 type:complete len:234 (-) Transcript_3385:236-937(-)
MDRPDASASSKKITQPLPWDGTALSSNSRQFPPSHLPWFCPRPPSRPDPSSCPTRWGHPYPTPSVNFNAVHSYLDALRLTLSYRIALEILPVVREISLRTGEPIETPASTVRTLGCPSPGPSPGLSPILSPILMPTSTLFPPQHNPRFEATAKPCSPRFSMLRVAQQQFQMLETLAPGDSAVPITQRTVPEIELQPPTAVAPSLRIRALDSDAANPPIRSSPFKCKKKKKTPQ